MSNTALPAATSNSSEEDLQRWAILGGLVLAVVAVYWNMIWALIEVVWPSPMYNHGYLIPLFSAYLIHARREAWATVTDKERWWGVGLVALSMVLRVLASIMVQFTVDRLSLILCLAGVFVLVGGLRTIRWAGPGLAFLVFMFPLPRYVVDNVLRPLQTMATIGSVYALQTLGVDVYREGNRIELEHSEMNVVDACAGLRMATIFVALAVALVLISNHRPWWERLIVLLSSLPIALAVNCIRITLTGFLYNLKLDEKVVNHIFHDFPGLIMMPLALGFLFLEMQILSRLVIEDKAASSGLSMGMTPPR